MSCGEMETHKVAYYYEAGIFKTVPYDSIVRVNKNVYYVYKDSVKDVIISNQFKYGKD